MNTQVDHLVDQALALPVEDRSAIVAMLIDSLDSVDEAAISEAWAVEIKKRRADILSGKSKVSAWSEAKARLSLL
jgi:putative addiction module component (TIGR02574 family)